MSIAYIDDEGRYILEPSGLMEGVAVEALAVALLERDRIVELLQDERSSMSHGDDYYNDPLGYAIALIKGESK